MEALRDFGDLTIDEIESLADERFGVTLDVMNCLDIMGIHPSGIRDYRFEASMVGSLVTSRWDDFRLAVFIRYVFDESFNTSDDWRLYRGLASELKRCWPDDCIDPETFPLDPVEEAAEHFAKYDAVLGRVWDMYRDGLKEGWIAEVTLETPPAAKPCKHVVALMCRLATQRVEAMEKLREIPVPDFDIDWDLYQ